MPGQLAQKWRAKYPGDYDDLDTDITLEKKIIAKYPGDYDDLASPEAKGVSTTITPVTKRKEPTWTQSAISTGLRTIPAIAGGIGGGATGLFGAGVGAIPGAIAGGAAGSGIGEGLAEWYEKSQGLRENINPAQIAVQTGLGAIPIPGGKVAGAGIKGLAGYAAKGAAKGALLGGASTIPTELAETGHLPSLGQIGSGSLGGGLVGGATTGIAGLIPRVRTGGINPAALPQQPAVNVVPPVTPVPSHTPITTPVAPITPPTTPNTLKVKSGGQLLTQQEIDDILKGTTAPPTQPSHTPLTVSPVVNPPNTQSPIVPPATPKPKAKAKSKAKKLPAIEGELGWRNNLKFMEKNPELKTIMDKFIKTRSASEAVGKSIRDKFEHIGSYTKDDIVKFQKEMEAGQHPEIRKFYDDIHADLTKRKIDLGYKGNYLPQLWDNTTEEISKVFGSKTMRSKAPFQMKSIIADYEAGIAKGLKPKMSPLELAEYYGKRADRLIADNTALRELKKAGYLVRSKRAIEGMQEMDPNLGSFKDPYAKAGYHADPRVKTIIENSLKGGTGTGRIAQALSKGVGKVTSTMLSSGIIPNKPLFTAHGYNIASPIAGSAKLEGGYKRAFQAMKYGFSPKSAEKYLKSKSDKIVWAMKEHGFKSNVENVPGAEGEKLFTNEAGRFGTGKVKKAFNWLSDKQGKYFEKPLFDKMIPATKFTAWEANYDKFIKKGMTDKAAGKAATEVTDTFYSGKNMDLMYSNPEFQKYMRIMTLAPDWLRHSIDMGIKIPSSYVKLLKNPKDPVARKYAAAGAKTMAAYAAANLLQKSVTGKFMFENSATDQFNIDTGMKDSQGKAIKIKPFGSSIDFLTAPAKVAMATKEGNTLSEISQQLENKGSPLTQALFSFKEGENFKGEPNLAGRSTDKFGNKIPFGARLGNTFAQAINYGPPQISSPYNLAAGRMSPEEAIARVGEMPLIFRDNKKKRKFRF